MVDKYKRLVGAHKQRTTSNMNKGYLNFHQQQSRTQSMFIQRKNNIKHEHRLWLFKYITTLNMNMGYLKQQQLTYIIHVAGVATISCA